MEINLQARIVDSSHDLETMQTLIESASPDLKRLLQFGDSTVKALSNKIDLSVVNHIDRVRRSLYCASSRSTSAGKTPWFPCWNQLRCIKSCRASWRLTCCTL